MILKRHSDFRAFYLLLAAASMLLVLACTKNDKDSEGDVTGNELMYEISPKIDMSDGISQAEYDNINGNIEVKTGVDVQIVWRVEFIRELTGVLLKTEEGKGTTDATDAVGGEKVKEQSMRTQKTCVEAKKTDFCNCYCAAKHVRSGY
ncbi:hypothetical protein CHS0354_018486 [Potamilus streckersoni]|uniref:Uncharacterized protein n=1 Tax=Potamilus streckersoni TaxID=2493646 RepID=A0AAE0TAP4_9BIVA|nr:hypothetical protein CHS0354_018486 [Potamilus streckersoni]